MEHRYAKHRRRKDRMDFALGTGNSDPGPIDTVFPAWMHVSAMFGPHALCREIITRVVERLGL